MVREMTVLRAKYHLLKQKGHSSTGPDSASVSASGNAGSGVEATLKDRVLQEPNSKLV